MITLAAASTLRGIAGTATAVTMSVFGDEIATGTDSFKKLYQGQLPTSVTTLDTVPGSTQALIKTMMLLNVTASPVTIELYVDGTAATNRITAFTIPANGEALWAADGWKLIDSTGALVTTSGGGGGGSSFGIVTGNTGTATADVSADTIAITGTGVISTAAGDGPETLVISSAALTGDVTTSGAAATIANDAVTNAKAANMAAATIKGRALGAGTGDPTDLTGAQAADIMFPAWTTYTPTFTQTATITKTVTFARYYQVGKTVTFTLGLAATSAGTAGAFVRVGLPVAPLNDNQTVFCAFQDASPAASYVMLGFTKTGTNDMIFLNDASGSAAFGNAPAVTVASGDTIFCAGTYEAA